MSGRGGKAPRGRAGFNSKSGGISLERFARAKKSTYDPRGVKEKERARTAITVAKYRKLKKRLQRASDIPTSSQPQEQQELLEERVDSDNEEEDDAEEHPVTADPSIKNRDSDYPNKRRKHNDDKKRRGDNSKEELDEQEEAAKAAAAAQREAAKQRRRNEHKLYKKKTHHGQPLMKHRIEKMLHQLENN